MVDLPPGWALDRVTTHPDGTVAVRLIRTVSRGITGAITTFDTRGDQAAALERALDLIKDLDKS